VNTYLGVIVPGLLTAQVIFFMRQYVLGIPDFIGVTRRVVEQETGTRCLHVQGAAGNINPIAMSNTWANPESLGLQLAAEVLKTFWGLEGGCQSDDGGAGVVSVQRELRLPGLVSSDSFEDAKDRLAKRELEVLRHESDGDAGALYWAKKRLERAELDLKVLSGEAPLPVVGTEISAARIGRRVGLVSAPGEVITEIGPSIVERSPFDLTFYCGYTNGSIHYVPTRSAYAEGGYEVENACIVAPEAGEQLEEASVSLLAEIATSS
jgi:neutral ceramidase